MLLSEAVGSILHDLTKAQDYANEYSNQISNKYKKNLDKEDNGLSNYPVPIGRLQEIELELKFAIQQLKFSKKIDISETHDNCRKLAAVCIDTYAINEFKKFINEKMKVKQMNVDSEAKTDDINSVDLSKQTVEYTDNSEVLKKIKTSWLKIQDTVSSKEFKEYLKNKISQELCNYFNKQYYQNNNIRTKTEAVKKIIAEQILAGIIEHEDIQDTLKQTEIKTIVQEGKIEEQLKKIFQDKTNDHVMDKDVREITSHILESETEIEVNLSKLKEHQGTMISSLKIKAQLDNYKWMITKTSQSLEKVHD